jgi:hypothetical protein
MATRTSFGIRKSGHRHHPQLPRMPAAPAQPGSGWLVGGEGDRALVSSGWADQGIDGYRLSDSGAPTYERFIHTRGAFIANAPGGSVVLVQRIPGHADRRLDAVRLRRGARARPSRGVLSGTELAERRWWALSWGLHDTREGKGSDR